MVPPVIAIIGRPNVGKSTLFNCLTRTRNAIVADLPGVTRDRQYGEGEIEGHAFIIIDTGGIDEEKGITSLMTSQAKAALTQADVIIFLVDGKSGLVGADQEIANTLRQVSKPVFLVVNKTDGADADVVKGDFYQLGLGDPIAIASAHRRGINGLIRVIFSKLSDEMTTVESVIESSANVGIKIAIVGRPNVGKSTLINRILGEERVIVYDSPGTTRDSIFIPFERQKQQYTLIDTAGIRRRSRINEPVEKISVIKSLQAIEASNVVVFIVDARENIAEQDLRLLGFIVEAGKALVLAVNKWDGLDDDVKNNVRKEMTRRLQFLPYVEQHFISALHGTGVGNLFESIQKAYHCAMMKVPTNQLNELLQKALRAHQPPLVRGRRIKLRYAHIGGQNPPVIVIHGNQLESLPKAYKRYLIHFFQKRLKLVGTPVRLEFKTTENPFAKQ